MDHYFIHMHPVISNEHNMDIINHLLNQFIDEVKGEMEAWSERGSGWIMDKIRKLLSTWRNISQCVMETMCRCPQS